MPQTDIPAGISAFVPSAFSPFFLFFFSVKLFRKRTGRHRRVGPFRYIRPLASKDPESPFDPWSMETTEKRKKGCHFLHWNVTDRGYFVPIQLCSCWPCSTYRPPSSVFWHADWPTYSIPHACHSTDEVGGLFVVCWIVWHFTSGKYETFVFFFVYFLDFSSNLSTRQTLHLSTFERQGKEGRNEVCWLTAVNSCLPIGGLFSCRSWQSRRSGSDRLTCPFFLWIMASDEEGFFCVLCWLCVLF